MSVLHTGWADPRIAALYHEVEDLMKRHLLESPVHDALTRALEALEGADVALERQATAA